MDPTELRRQHDDISVVVQALAKATADHATPQSVGAVRWQLARLLMGHLALEDRFLYPAMLWSHDDHTRSVAATLKKETGALAQTFTRYMSDWSDDRISRDWAGFCQATGAIIHALTDRVNRENRTLYPLAAAADRAPPQRAKAG